MTRAHLKNYIPSLFKRKVVVTELADKEAELYFNNLMALKNYFSLNKEIIEPKLDMTTYRHPETQVTVDCPILGCILGHAIGMPRFKEHFKLVNYGNRVELDFDSFSKNAFNLDENTSMEWDYLFGTSNTNSIDDFLERLDIHLRDTYPKFYLTGDKNK